MSTRSREVLDDFAAWLAEMKRKVESTKNKGTNMAASARWLASANRWVESPGFTNRPYSPTEVAFEDWSEFLDHAQEWLGTPPADYPANFGDLVDRYEATYKGIGLVPPRDQPPAQPPPPGGFWRAVKEVIDWWRKWNNPVLPGGGAESLKQPREVVAETWEVAMVAADGLASVLADYPDLRKSWLKTTDFEVSVER